MTDWIFWDNDGVLVDTEELYFLSNRETLATTGIDLTRELFVQISFKEGRSTFDLATENGIDSETIARLHAERNRRYIELLTNGVKIYDGVKETLERLYGKVSMAVVTSCRREHFNVMHHASGLLPFFDFVLTSDDVSRTKPDPEPYLKALKRSKSKPGQCIVVEDTERGLMAANIARLKCIVIPNAFSSGGNYSGAYRIFNNVRDVVGEVLPS